MQECFKKVENSYKENIPTRGELLLQPRGKSSAMHNFTNIATFEQVYLHLALSTYLDNNELRNLNACGVLFAQLCEMIKKMRLNYVSDLFDHNLNYAN